MNVLDLFSGIGGFSLGLERAGMQTVAFCEIDPYCRAVLAKHWPGIPCHGDIRAIPRIGNIDLVCGGFPCQPFSHAGKQTSKDDDRYLWPAMRDVIARERPAWVVGENVTGIIGLALDDVLHDLEALGYSPRALAIPAGAVGAPHKRERVWILARDTNKQGQPAQSVDAETPRLPSDATHADGSRLPKRQGEPGVDAGTRKGHQGEDPTVRGWWDIEPDVGRVANGIPRRMDRLRALGNAVVPQVVEIIGRAIMREAA